MELFTIGFASDHAGFKLKDELAGYFAGKGYCIRDYGAYSTESSDYPDFAHPLAEGILSGDCRFGVSVCWSANGISMTLNRHKGIRAAICSDEETAKLARNHNDANVCSLAAMSTELDKAVKIVETFLSEPFEGGRHQRRVEKIDKF